MSIPRIAALAAVAGLALLAGACRDAAGPAPAVGELRFAPAEPHVEAGKTLQLTVAVLDPFGQPAAGVPITAFRSGDPGVATVSPAGMVTGVAQGATRIQAFAGGVEARVAVVVDPPGGVRPDSFHLIVPNPAAGYILVDSWPLAPQVLRFALSNAAGASLCGLVPLRIEVGDSSRLTAEYQPGRDGCSIRLGVPAGPWTWGSTVLRVWAGGLGDSVEVEVHRTRYRVAFGSVPQGVKTVAAGGHVRYEVMAVGADGAPAAGFPVRFVVDTVQAYRGTNWIHPPVVITAVTDAAGVAAVDAPAPFSTRVRQSGGYYAYAPAVWVSATNDETDYGERAPVVDVVAGAPDHIAVYGYFTGGGPGNHHWEWREMKGDTARFPVDLFYCWIYGNTLGAVVVDRYGNATSAQATATAAPGILEAGGSGPFQVNGSYWPGDYYPDSRIVSFGLPERDLSTPVTFSAPGIPSRTMQLVIRQSACRA
ncbi:MAG TPA: Ig-like domain-containing protein [Longimicrobium sp.]|nr:Ig-like domain-containing protein [Longimicrobium sp.]